jgi:hypothetical protein
MSSGSGTSAKARAADARDLGTMRKTGLERIKLKVPFISVGLGT